jgi:hypothetical protein
VHPYASTAPNHGTVHRGLFLSDRRDRKQREELDFSEAHGLDKQRADQIICLMVGSDQE